MKEQPGIPYVTFALEIRVPQKDWENTKRLGFVEADLPEMVEGMLSDLGGQGATN